MLKMQSNLVLLLFIPYRLSPHIHKCSTDLQYDAEHVRNTSEGNLVERLLCRGVHRIHVPQFEIKGKFGICERESIERVSFSVLSHTHSTRKKKLYAQYAISPFLCSLLLL